MFLRLASGQFSSQLPVFNSLLEDIIREVVDNVVSPQDGSAFNFLLKSLLRDVVDIFVLLLDGMVFNSLFDSLLRDDLDIFILIDLRDGLSLVFNSIVISYFLLSGNIFHTLDSFVFDGFLLYSANIFHTLDSFLFNYCLLIRNVLNARFTFNDFSIGRH